MTGERAREYAIVLVVSAALVIGLVLLAGPWQLAEQLAKADLFLVGMAVVLYITALGMKAVRWRLLLTAARYRVRGTVALSQYAMAQAINDLTPARVLGEGARIWGVNRVEGVPIGTGLATVMTEKVMDLVLVTSVLLASVAALYPAIPLRAWGPLAALSTLVAMFNLGIIVLLRRPDIVEWGGRVSNRIARRFRGGRYAGEVESEVEKTVGSFDLARQSTWGPERSLVVIAALLTVPVWALEFARLALIFWSLEVFAPLPAVVIASSLALTFQLFLPAGGGSVAVITDILAGVGVTLAAATAAGLLSVATSIWITVPIALVALLLTGRQRLNGPSSGASDPRDDS